MLQLHEAFIAHALAYFQRDERIVGLACAGSFITKTMDEFSDIDFVVAVEPDRYEQVMAERFDMVEHLGTLLSAFTGDHVGEPRVLICLYGNPLLHVDVKFVSLDDIAHRVENVSILWERGGRISAKLKEEPAKFPLPDIQWIEERFWVWIHYGATKIGRGEIFETIEFISFLRQSVIGPLILQKEGKQPKGVRKIEYDAPEYLDRLKATVACYDKGSCYSAIKMLIELYKELREVHKFESSRYNTQAEKAAVAYLDDVAKKYL
ncbi:nucleotidyltransferase domain-containing protein [Sediminispirochaeta bajacaliforniensis]|uniref:nucleotidyltransferase domain-containing protein n=1 Tax=Sediminispirochaeta bajacaliforniensis TaxID=148 RepID=UPI000362ACC4|nr:nucleotidyltransferase domain-containing protein [Sediminispirochaeta bajacaliforniensis]